MMKTVTVELITPATRKFVLKEPWGWEDWILNDEIVNLCQKVLFIKAGKRGSIHMHPIKDEVLTCASGCLVVAYLEGNPATMARSGLQAMIAVQTVQVVPGMAVRFRPGAWHRLSATTGDTYVYEASTFHRDEDVERAAAWADVLGSEDEEN